jgi:hypothetical protein
MPCQVSSAPQVGRRGWALSLPCLGVHPRRVLSRFRACQSGRSGMYGRSWKSTWPRSSETCGPTRRRKHSYWPPTEWRPRSYSLLAGMRWSVGGDYSRTIGLRRGSETFRQPRLRQCNAVRLALPSGHSGWASFPQCLGVHPRRPNALLAAVPRSPAGLPGLHTGRLSDPPRLGYVQSSWSLPWRHNRPIAR